MRVAALCSGGKDSTLVLRRALEGGHEVTCVLAMLLKRRSSRYYDFNRRESEPNIFGDLSWQVQLPKFPFIMSSAQRRAGEWGSHLKEVAMGYFRRPLPREHIIIN